MPCLIPSLQWQATFTSWIPINWLCHYSQLEVPTTPISLVDHEVRCLSLWHSVFIACLLRIRFVIPSCDLPLVFAHCPSSPSELSWSSCTEALSRVAQSCVCEKITDALAWWFLHDHLPLLSYSWGCYSRGSSSSMRFHICYVTKIVPVLYHYIAQTHEDKVWHSKIWIFEQRSTTRDSDSGSSHRNQTK